MNYAMIQYISVLLLIPDGCTLTDKDFLYADIVALVPLSIMMAWTGANPKLTEHLPTASLMYLPVIISVVGSTLIQLGFQVFFFLHVKKQPFYFEPKLAGEYTIAGDNIMSYQATVLFWVSNFQFLSTAIAFSIAYPFRKQIWTNVPYLLVIIAVLAMDLAVLWLPYTNVIS
jgi:cation-transporting ATPase 13A3/4/5